MVSLQRSTIFAVTLTCSALFVAYNVLAEQKAAGDRVAVPVVTPGHCFRDQLADGRPCPDCPKMVMVPSGSFTMGSPVGELGRADNEGPQHSVAIGEPFAIGKFEVTFAQWDACLVEGGCVHRPADRGLGRGNLPVTGISWNDITTEYLPWLSRKTGKTYRLPTEAEWEYAARAGSSTPFWWGEAISTDLANYNGYVAYGSGLKSENRQKPVPVDSFAVNAWGLHNVHGNVWEWVQDCFNPSYMGAPSDGAAWTVGDCHVRVLRGGGWANIPESLRSATRAVFHPHGRGIEVGFRVARSLDPRSTSLSRGELRCDALYRPEDRPAH